jgi:hypothetical protein
MKSRILLGTSDKGFQVRVVVEARDDQVHVIGHEAVRTKDVPPLTCGAQELRQDEFDVLRIDEHRAPVFVQNVNE